MPPSGMSVGTCAMSVALSGHSLVGTYSGTAGSLALFYIQLRGARFLISSNASLASSLATASPSGVSNILAGALAGAQSTAAALASQCEDDAALVTYLQTNAFANLPADSVDGSHPASELMLTLN